MTSRAPLCRALLAATTLFLIAPTWSAQETLSPYTFEGQYRLDYWTGLSGPLKNRLGHSGLFDLRFAVDAEKPGHGNPLAHKDALLLGVRFDFAF